MNVQLILAIDLGTDILPALALAVEKGEGGRGHNEASSPLKI